MVTPKARGIPVAPQARGALVAPQARGALVAPQARGALVAPQARGALVAPQARGVFATPPARGHLATLLARACLAAPLALALPAAAQDSVEAMPGMIVSATRLPTAIERVPAAVTLIDRQTIDERGYKTLAEALLAVPGLRMVQAGGVGQQASAFVRGGNSRYVLVMIDGVPVNDPSEPNGAFNFGSELLGDIERIEILRGAGTALYGSGAVGAVINMITRRAPSNTPFQLFGSLGGGTQGTVGGMLGAAGTTEHWDYMVVGQGLATQGFDVTGPRFTANTRETESFRGALGTARLGWTPAPDIRLEGLLRWRENQLDLDDVPNDDPNYTGTDRRWFGQIRAEATLLDGAWTTGLRVAYADDRRSYVNLPDGQSSATTSDLYRGQRRTVEWGNQMRLGTVGPFTDAGLAFGVIDWRESADQQSGSPFFRTTTNASIHHTALHAGVQGQLFERLDLSAGLRQDHAEDYDNYLSWRAGAVLHLPELSSRLRAAAGTSFKAPSLFQRYGQIGTYFQGNPELRPETSLAWEIGVETDLPAFGRADGLTTSVTWFDTWYEDLINFNTTFSSLENVDRARAQGLELGLGLRPATWLDARITWTILHARDEATGAPLARRPRNVVALNARVAATERLVIAPELLYVGPSPETAAYDNDGNFLSGITYNKAGTVLNLTGSYRVAEGLVVYAEGRNLTNSSYEPANGFILPGRSLLVGARFVY